MAKETIETVVKGGAATAGPPLGPKLGPMGVNIGQVIAEINKKTDAMKGIDVPVKVIIDTDTKEFEITIGTPSVASLLKKEFGLKKASGSPKEVKAMDTPLDHIIKVAKVKQDGLLANDLKNAVKEVLGTCVSMGILIEGKTPQEIQKEIDEGKYDAKFSENAELKLLSQQEIDAKRREFEAGLEAVGKKEEPAKVAEPAEAKNGEKPPVKNNKEAAKPTKLEKKK